MGESVAQHREKFSIESAWIRCFAALSALLVETWLVNSVLYPQVSMVIPEARDAASLVGVAGFVAFAVAASKRPSLLDERRLAIGSFAGYGTGLSLIAGGLLYGNPALVFAGACLRTLSTRWFVIQTGLALCNLGGRSCMLCIASSFVASYLLRIPFEMAGGVVSGAVLAAIPCVVFFLVRGLAGETLSYVRSGSPRSELSITQPETYVPFAHALFASFFVFRIAYGFALAFGSTEGNPHQTLFGLIPVALVCAMVFLPKMPKADMLFQAAALLVIAGFLVAVAFGGYRDGWPFHSVVNGLLYAGSECFEILMWFVLVSIGSRNKANSLVVFAWGRAACSAGLLAGVTIGHAVNGFDGAIAGSAAIAVVLFSFVAVNMTVFKNLGFQATIEGVRSEKALVVQTCSESGLAEKSLCAAQRYALTKRETEILGMLARGRNASFVQEQLTVSRNTVKTHVANIYAKLGVHSQQELIDLVEQIEPVRL